MKRVITYLRMSIMPFLAAFTIIFVVSNLFHIIYQFIIAFYVGITQGHEVLTDVGRLTREIAGMMSQNVLYLISIVAVFICGVVFYFWYRHETRGASRTDLSVMLNRRTLLYFLLLGIGCQFVFSGAMNLIQPMFPTVFKDYGETMKGLLSSNLLLVLFYTLVIAPISEELIFRGVTLYRAAKVLPFFGANLLQAILFGMYHRNIVQGIYAAVMGFVLGLVYRRYRSIYAAIILHILINASSFCVVLFPPSTISYIIMATLGLTGSTYAFLVLKLGGQKAN